MGVSIATPDSGPTILLDWFGQGVVGTVVNPNDDEYLSARCRYLLVALGWFGLWDDSLTPEQFGFESYGSCWEAPIDVYRLGMVVLLTAQALGWPCESVVVSAR